MKEEEREGEGRCDGGVTEECGASRSEMYWRHFRFRHERMCLFVCVRMLSACLKRKQAHVQTIRGINKQAEANVKTDEDMSIHALSHMQGNSCDLIIMMSRPLLASTFRSKVSILK